MSALEHRIPPPILMAAMAVLMWLVSSATGPVAMGPDLRWVLAAALAIASITLAAPAVVAFRRYKTTINPVDIDRASTLVTTGVYGFTRNPMYLSLTLLLCAWAIYLAAPWTLLGPIVFAAFIDRFQILPEERAMHAKFGSQYDAYVRRVRRWI